MTEQDMELTRLSAKAAGIELEPGTTKIVGSMKTWRPSDDDGDALRLAVKLDIVFRCINGVAFAWKDGICDMQEPYSDDRCAAVRRAIVRAAAEIGKQMELNT
jgi:hypothetical protein